MATPDPWAVPVPSPRRRRPVAVGIGVLGVAAAVLAQVWDHGPATRAGGIVLAVAVVVAAWGALVPHAAARVIAAGAVAVAIGSGVAEVGGAAVLVALAAVAVVVATSLLRLPAPAARPPIGVAVAAGVVWWRTAEAAPSLGVVAFAAALVAVGAWAPRRVAVVAQRVDRALAAALDALLLLVALPAVYAPGAIGARFERRDGWVDRAPDLDAERRGAPRPFAVTDVSRPRRAAGLAVGALALVVAGYGGAVLVRDDAPDRAVTGADVATPDVGDWPAARGLPYAQELMDEQSGFHLPTGPVRLDGLGDMSTRYTNVVGGVRRTREPACGCPTTAVWFTGGSAAFGLGQRDDHTIASELVRLADADGAGLEIRNVAVPGYTLWQEYQSVSQRLAAVTDFPDVVVFYDGFNDVLDSLSQTVADGPAWDRQVSVDDSSLQRFLALDPDELASTVAELGGAEGLGARIAQRYAALRATIAADLGSRGIRTVFLLQPDALASRAQREVALTFSDEIDGPHADAIAAVFDATETALGDGATDLRQVYDDVTAPVFFDIAHTNERGATVVAEAAYPLVRAAVTG